MRKISGMQENKCEINTSQSIKKINNNDDSITFPFDPSSSYIHT